MFVFEWFKNRRKYAGFQAAMAKGDIPSAVDALDEIIRSDPKSTRPYLEKALLLHYDNPENALVCYDKAIELGSQCAEAFFGRGHIYYDRKLYEKAVEDFSAAIRIDPKHQGAYRNRGSSYGQIGMADNAFADYENSLKPNPNDGLTYSCRGWAHYRAERFSEAVDDFTKAMSLDERLVAGCLSGRADAYEKNGKEDLAKQDRKLLSELGVSDNSRDLNAELLHREKMDKQLLSMRIFKKCKLDALRQVDHTLIVPLERKGLLISRLMEIGMTIESVEDDEDGSCTLTCHEEIALKNISQRTSQLVRLAFELELSYDGWGTMVPQSCDD